MNNRQHTILKKIKQLVSKNSKLYLQFNLKFIIYKNDKQLKLNKKSLLHGRRKLVIYVV